MLGSRYDDTPYAVVDGVISYSLRPFTRTLISTSDRYYAVQSGDSWPRMAWILYGDEKLWWFLADANDVLDPFLELPAGRLVRVPALPRGVR